MNHTWERKAVSAALFLSLAISLAGCAKEEEPTTKSSTEAETQIETGSETDNGHLVMQLDDMVSIDAVVTPEECYENGVSSYYITQYYDTFDGYDAADFEENPILFGQDLQQQLSLLASFFSVSFAEEEKEIVRAGDEQITLTVPDRSGGKLFAYWELDNTEPLQRLVNAHVSYKTDDTEFQSEADMALSMGTVDAAECRYADAPQKVQALADQAKELARAFTGEEIASDCLCVPLSSLGEDAYAFYCFYETDSLAWRKQELDVSFSASAILSEDVLGRMYGGTTATNLFVYGPQVYYLGGRFCGINAYRFAFAEEVYKEKETVTDLDEILSLAKKLLFQEFSPVPDYDYGYQPGVQRLFFRSE